MLSALYRGDREEAERLAEGRNLDLFEAAALGRASRVDEVLREAPEQANATMDDGFTALHLAAFFSANAESARLLLDAGTDPDALADNETGPRPINSAAAASSNEIVALLLERGADVAAAQHGGYTPLHSAAANGNGSSSSCSSTLEQTRAVAPTGAALLLRSRTSAGIRGSVGGSKSSRRAPPPAAPSRGSARRPPPAPGQPPTPASAGTYDGSAGAPTLRRSG